MSKIRKNENEICYTVFQGSSNALCLTALGDLIKILSQKNIIVYDRNTLDTLAYVVIRQKEH